MVPGVDAAKKQPSSILNAARLLRREDHEQHGGLCYLPVSPGAWLRGCCGENFELGFPLSATFPVRSRSLQRHSERIELSGGNSFKASQQQRTGSGRAGEMKVEREGGREKGEFGGSLHFLCVTFVLGGKHIWRAKNKDGAE